MKLYVGATLGNYSASGNTLTISDLPYGMNLIEDNLLAIENKSQQIFYYKADGSVNKISGITSNVITFSGITSIATTDKFLIVAEIEDNSRDEVAEAIRQYEIDPAKTWYDTVQTLNTNTVFTTSWTVLGSPSEITMEGYNVLTLFVKSEKNIASTNLRYRFIGRHTAGGAEEFPIAATVLSDGDIVSGRDATTGARYYELNDDAILVQWDMFQIKTGNGISTIEVEQQCESYTATTRSTIYYTKSYNNN